MKKAILVGLALVTGLLIASCGSKSELKVFMPNEYIKESLVEQFESEFDVDVQIITFDSNETALPQVEANRYDLVVPSDYAIEELAAKGLLQPIDWTKLTSMNSNDLDPALQQFLNKQKDAVSGFDYLDVSVPYFWGNVGILYDTTKVEKSFLEANGWSSLLDGTKKVMFYDSSRDMMMIALKALYENVDINNPTEAQLQEAEDWLAQGAQNKETTFASDEVLDDMLVAGDTKYAMAVTYSGDAVYLMSENADLDYYVPERGTNVWMDGFVIPNNAQEVDLAYDFINFMTHPEQMYANSEEIGYTAPRADVIQKIIADEVYPSASYQISIRETDSVFRYKPELKTQIEQIWARVRSAP
jgi:spermidine/putrescine transport system substrate-binding protein